MDTRMGNTYGQQQSRYSLSTSSHDSSSVSSAGSAQTLLPPPSSLYSTSGTGRTLPEPMGQPPAGRSPVGFGGSDLRYHPYAASSGSPSSVGGSMPEPTDQYSSAAISPTNLAGSNLGPQKRAYRQRRKDPSCDACRERKVKCDATETSSCSECSSRNVKCQFTKETNRRMSSIKQVQDLQNQLVEAKQEIDHLRSMLQNVHPEPGRTPAAISLPSLTPQMRLERQQHLPTVPNFDHVRRNLRKYSRGVFKIPPGHRHNMPTPLINSPEPALPPVELVEALLRTYHDQMQRQAPMIHWPTFMQQWEKVRKAGNFIGTPQIWTGLFFSVLACGTLQASSPADSDVEGMRYIVISARLLNTWTDNLLLEHAKTALLISVFLYEQNTRSAAWVWLGTAIRMSQEIGLELESGPWSALELESRTRTYWAIVSWDRLLSIQENRPFQVDIGEGDGTWPATLDDHWLTHSGNLRPSENAPGYSTVSVILPVIRFIGKLKTSLTARIISRDTLHTYDDYFRAIHNTFPEQLQSHSDSYLEPFVFSAVIPLLFVRFQLYRHNINVYATAQERAEAIDRCHSVAFDTVRYLGRTMRTPPSSPFRLGLEQPRQTWRQMMDAMVHNLLCRHVWRCTLILCLRGDFNSALTCIRFSEAIGSARKLNIACGRNLAFFLDRLTERVQVGMSQQDIESDLELLAYASGDLQGDLKSGFVWAGVQTSTYDSPGPAGASSSLPPFEEEDLPASALLTDKEMNDWGGWEHVGNQVARLIDEQNRRQHSQHSPYLPTRQTQTLYHRPAHNETKRVQLTHPDGTPSPGGVAGTGASPTTGSTPPAGASRISIANII